MSIAHTIVYKDAGAYSCFPDVVRLACGELCVTFRCVTGFSLDALRPGKFDHVDRRARIALSRSRDDGVTWGSPNVFPPFDAECGEQDPSITQLLDGSLMINFFCWRVVSAQEKGRLAHPALHLHDGSWSDVEGPWVIRSRDGGAHWETTPVRVDSSPLHRASTSDAVVELANGTLLMPVYSIRPGSPAHLAYVVRSIDGGETWGEPAIIAHDPAGRISFEEPALVQTRQGHLLAMLRAGEPGTYEYLHQAISHDEGAPGPTCTRPLCGGIQLTCCNCPMAGCCAPMGIAGRPLACAPASHAMAARVGT